MNSSEMSRSKEIITHPGPPAGSKMYRIETPGVTAGSMAGADLASQFLNPTSKTSAVKIE